MGNVEKWGKAYGDDARPSGQTATRTPAAGGWRDKAGSAYIRTTPKIKGRLKNRSDENGRSVTQEAEFCIEAWLAHEEVFGGRRMAALLRLMASTAILLEGDIGRGSMMTDYWTYSAVEQAWNGIIASHRPLPTAEVVELLDEAVRLDKETSQAPEYPLFPIPHHGRGFFASEEQRHEHEASVREWEQQTAEWRAKLAERKQKSDAALSRFKHFEELGRNIAKTFKNPDQDLQAILAGVANQTDSPASEDQ